MNDILQKAAKDYLKEGLALLTDKNRDIFTRMYSHKNLNLPINDVVDKIPSDRLDHAMIQVQRSLSKMEVIK